MTVEELIHHIGKLSGTGADFPTVVWVVNSAMANADEIISCNGGGEGLDSVLISLTKDRDLYPLPDDYVRVQAVERLDQQAFFELNLVSATMLAEARVRNARGGYAAIVNRQLRIYPIPSTDEENGLRVWLYLKHSISLQGMLDAPVTFPAHSEQFVVWSAVAALSENANAKKRAAEQAGIAEVTFRKLIEIQHAGPGNVIRREVQ